MPYSKTDIDDTKTAKVYGKIWTYPQSIVGKYVIQLKA